MQQGWQVRVLIFQTRKPALDSVKTWASGFAGHAPGSTLDCVTTSEPAVSQHQWASLSDLDVGYKAMLRRILQLSVSTTVEVLRSWEQSHTTCPTYRIHRFTRINWFTTYNTKDRRVRRIDCFELQQVSFQCITKQQNRHFVSDKQK